MPITGAQVSHLDCAPGYTATYYIQGLRSPDGLAFDPHGVLHVVEEGAFRVSRVDGDGTRTRVLGRLQSPEGIAFDDAGNLYVVEDTGKGRLVRMAPDGQVTTLAKDLDAPEGVAVGPAAIYVTESNVQFERNPFDLRSGITAFSATGETTPVIADTPRLRGLRVAFWSYAGLAVGPEGRLYVTNELSGRQISRRIALFSGRLNYTARLWTRDSIFAIDPVRGTRTRIARDLLAPEGLSFAADGDFPLYVAEENVGWMGRLSRIERNGRRTTVCDHFHGIEDVAVDANGDLYASEDRSGSIIRITVSEGAGSLSEPDPGLSAPDRLRRGLEQIVALARRIARPLRSD